tara:strand:- start:401 stop:577 length:177 start_codon:yes stop_codon:yes gene_type:complete
MNVEQLIKRLREFPKSARVAIANHDNDSNELSGLVGQVDELEDGEHREAYGSCVVIRS